MNTVQSKTQSNQVNQNYLSFVLLASLLGSTSRGSMSLDYPFSPNKTGILTQVSRTIVPFISAIPHLLTFQLTFYRILVCIKKNPFNCIGKTLHCHTPGRYHVAAAPI